MWFYLIAIITVPAVLAIVAYVLDTYQAEGEDDSEVEARDVMDRWAA